MTKAKRPRLDLRVKQSTKLIQRRTIAGGILSLFAIAFAYWNFGVNSTSFAAAVNYTWTGTTDSLWSTSTNWTPNGIPSSIDNVTIGTTARNPYLTSNQTVNNFTEINNGSLNINGKTLQINGNAAFNGGTILSTGSIGTILAQGITTTFGTGTTSMTINADITVTSSTITSTATTFNGATSFTKTGTSNDASLGNNTFNGNTTISTSGTGYFLMANSTRDIFNGELSFNSSGSGIIYVAYNGSGTQFNQNLFVSSTSTGGIRIGASTGTSTLATGKTINVGSSGVNSGLILLGGFSTSTNQSLTFTGTGVLQLGPNATFNGDVVANCPGIVLSGATYNGIANFTKTGASNNSGIGNNTFNGATTITNSGTGYILTSQSTRDIFNAEPDFISTSSGLIYVAYNGTGTQFNQNINVTSTGTGGVYFGASTGTSTLATGKTINVGSGGVNSGLILVGGLTTSTNQSLTFTGTGVLQLGPNATFNGDVVANCPGIVLSGGTYNGIANFTKTGTSNNSGLGNNTFNGATTITNSGTGYLLTSQSTRDIFNAEPNFISTSSGLIYVAYNGIGTQFNQNINVTSTGTGGVYFGASTGTSTLATGKTINVGSGGVNSGLILVGGLTTSTNQTLTFTGTGVLQLGPNATFNGDVVANCPGIVLSGATYNGIANFTKTGSSNNSGTGNNTFNGATTITNSGTGYILTSQSTRDIFNTEPNFISTSSGLIYVAHNGTGTQFNQNINVTSTGTGGVYFGASTGTSTLANGKTINVGSGGVSGGLILVSGLTTSTNQSLTFTGTGVLQLGPNTTFNGDVVANCPGIVLSGATYNGIANFTKTGTSNNSGLGNNTFNGATTITNSGTGYILTSQSTRDIFNAEPNFISTSSGIIYVAHNGTGTQFNQNINVTSTGTGGVYFGASTGTSILATGKTFNVGSGGVSGGLILIGGLTTSTNQSLTFTGTGVLQLGPNATFNGDVIANCPGIVLSGATYNGIANFTKTGISNNSGFGNNTFNGATTLTNSGTGFFLTANSTRDIFNSDLNLSCTNSGLMYIAYNGTGTQFNQNIIINNTGSGGIRFGSSLGTSTLASGKTISIGSSGFTSGELQLGKLTQVGNTSQSLNLSMGTGVLYLNSGTIFNGNVNISFPQLYLNGTTFNSNATLEKIGATNNTSTGSNVFNGLTSIKNSGTGILYLGNSSADDFNDNVTFIQTGTGALYPAYNSNTKFAKNISTLGSTSIITFASAAGGIVTLDGTSLQNFDGNVSYTPIINRLTIDNATNGLLLNVPLSVNKSLTLNSGIITTSLTNLLTLGTAISTVTNVSDSSYINGPVRKIGNTAFTFPTGKNNQYRPISISAPSAVTDHFTAEYILSDPNTFYNVNSKDASIHHMSRTEYWTLNRTNGASNVSVTLSWNPFSGGVSRLSDLRVGRWDLPLSKWIDLGNGLTTGDTISGTIKTTTSTSTFGTFALGSSSASNTLPVELMFFLVEKDERSALLKWQTASEKNNDYFTIEKTSDGANFQTVGTVSGVGNSSVKNTYQLRDENPFTGTSYYRLKQTDFDGKFEIFKLVVFEFDESQAEFKINKVGPNPFTDKLHLQCYSGSETELNIVILNSSATKVFQEIRTINEGENDLELTINGDLKAGIYFLQLTMLNKNLDPIKLVKSQ